MNTVDLIRPQLDRLQRTALIAGIIGLVLFIAGAAMEYATTKEIRHIFHSYLFAYMFWFGVTMGSTAWLLIHHVAGGGAFFLIRRLLEAASRNIWLAAVLFLPIAATLFMHTSGHHHPPLYEWANTDIVQGDRILREKDPYLNVPFFLARTVFYFVLWGVMVRLLNAWSRQQSEGDTQAATHKLSMWSALGLLLYVFTMTFATIDWVMSITPHWYSSLFGVIFIVGQGLSTLCLMHVLVNYLTRGTTLTSWVPQRYFRDLGNLTLAFTLLWAYTNYSQWAIIWSGNIAEEVEWYVPRVQTSWVYVGALLIACHFVLPFFSLLSSSLKVKIENLSKLAMFIILMRFIDLHFYIAPTFRQDGFSISPADIGAPLLLGGIWLTMWVKQMKASPTLIHVGDPRFVGQYEVPDSATSPAPQGVVSHG
jgi:hypothetical protein